MLLSHVLPEEREHFPAHANMEHTSGASLWHSLKNSGGTSIGVTLGLGAGSVVPFPPRPPFPAHFPCLPPFPPASDWSLSRLLEFLALESVTILARMRWSALLVS